MKRSEAFKGPTEGRVKQGLHPRNRFRRGYDFAALTECAPVLAEHVRPNAHGADSIDYADPKAVKALNQALLKHAYGVADWDIPKGYLCPPVPGRSDYLHHVADLLEDGMEIPRGPDVRVLDVGTGANLIYPLVGTSEYGWRFVGSEIDPVACQWACSLAEKQSSVRGLIECRLQNHPAECFRGVIREGERFDLTMCNPPFHRSAEDANEGSSRKRRHLKLDVPGRDQRNFGGQPNELWCEGGELGFIRRMIRQSVEFANRCGWFTTLVSKQDHLKPLEHELQRVNVRGVRVIKMAQGQKQSRILAWKF